MKRKQNAEAISEQEVTVNPELETPEHSDELIDEKAEINKLLDEGYSVKQIIHLGFKRRTAYHYAKQRMKPEHNPAAGNNSPAEGTTLAESVGKGKHELMKIGSKDMIPPEAVVEIMRFPQDGESLRVWQNRSSKSCASGLKTIWVRAVSKRVETAVPIITIVGYHPQSINKEQGQAFTTS